jgi:hypothetical protein
MELMVVFWVLSGLAGYVFLWQAITPQGWVWFAKPVGRVSFVVWLALLLAFALAFSNSGWQWPW